MRLQIEETVVYLQGPRGGPVQALSPPDTRHEPEASDVGWCGSDVRLCFVGWNRVAGLHLSPASSSDTCSRGQTLLVAARCSLVRTCHSPDVDGHLCRFRTIYMGRIPISRARTNK